MNLLESSRSSPPPYDSRAAYERLKKGADAAYRADVYAGESLAFLLGKNTHHVFVQALDRALGAAGYDLADTGAVRFSKQSALEEMAGKLLKVADVKPSEQAESAGGLSLIHEIVEATRMAKERGNLGKAA